MPMLRVFELKEKVGFAGNVQSYMDQIVLIIWVWSFLLTETPPLWARFFHKLF